MSKTWTRAAVVGGALAVLTAFGASAHEYKLGDLVIGHPWTRATVKGQPSAGAFLTVTNNGAAADRLMSAASPLARVAELHSMTMTDGVMKMRDLPAGIDLPAGQTVALVPGALHIMLVGPDAALAEGQRVPLSLTFEKAGTVEVELAVEKAGARGPGPVAAHDHAAGG